ncbi:putative beta-arrestin 1 [Schistosoma mansoni]|uniref:putative beta-arrestin 1 n=1 Tax=Schistosoma mansoni TaxID=6183 RepID=UPI0001A61D04|nr:putative beta-arrestin 1 [Schistosoma mansoni]|eukprot:XP_018651527.1 putative beta-arrestin 1 [Schistosoma mansoni]
MSTKRSIYKKNSPNNKLVVYLIQRDIFDDLQMIDPIEGIATIDKMKLKSSKVFARIRCTFRYGEQQLDDVLSGVTFYKEFFIQTKQIYPIDKNIDEEKYSEVQKRLIERFGDNALPFHFTLTHDIPASITLQMDNKNSLDDNPSILPKDIYFHGETIPLKLLIDNESSNIVRRLKIQVIQNVEITLFKRRTIHCNIVDIDTEKGFPIDAKTTGWNEIFQLRPSLQEIRGQTIIALDGKLKHQDTNLASSTLIKDYRKKENMGIIVQYMIRIKAVTGFGGRDVEMEIPIVLCHTRQEQDIVKAEEADNLIIQKFKRPSTKQHQISKETERMDSF